MIFSKYLTCMRDCLVCVLPARFAMIVETCHKVHICYSKSICSASQWWSNERMMVYFKLMLVKCSVMKVKCSSMRVKWVYDHTLISPSLTSIFLQFFHRKKGSFSVHSFNEDYLSIPECPGSCRNLFHEIPGSISFPPPLLGLIGHISKKKFSCTYAYIQIYFSPL